MQLWLPLEVKINNERERRKEVEKGGQREEKWKKGKAGKKEIRK